MLELRYNASMADNFVSYDRDTLFLMPPSVQDWLPEEHLARFVVDIVTRLDLRQIRDSYAGCGSAAYHPEMLVALLFYAYATGMRASRKIETATYESVAFRYLAANTHPDHNTIAAFRRRFLPYLQPLFNQILLLAEEADQADEAAETEMDFPEEIKRREDRLRALDEAKERIRAREAAREVQEQAEHEETLADRKRIEQSNGKKLKNRPPERPKKGV